VGHTDSPAELVDRLVAQAEALSVAPDAPDYVGIDNAADAHHTEGHWNWSESTRYR